MFAVSVPLILEMVNCVKSDTRFAVVKTDFPERVRPIIG